MSTTAMRHVVTLSPRVLLMRAVAAVALMAAAAVLASFMRPTLTASSAAPGTFERGIPTAFGDWKPGPQGVQQADLTVGGDGERTNDRPYDEVVSRNYIRADGRGVMLAVAYAAEQRQEVKVHRPDLCYPAQGFRMLHWSLTRFDTLVGARGPITGVRMLTKRDDRIEAVVYLLRTGENYGQRMWDGRVEILREGLQGRIADGLLVRASMLLERESDSQRAFGELEGFLVDLAQASAPQARAQMVR